MTTSSKQAFLDTYDKEHATTMRVLRSFPKDQSDFRPTPKNKTARELAWVFVLERGLGAKVWRDEFAKKAPAGGPPPQAPQSIDEIVGAYEKASSEWRQLISSTSDRELAEKVHFFVGPRQMGEMSRLEFAWFLLHDEIHHRGQFSIYLRGAGGKVPSIYGPTADEPWM